ncbi:Gfo/Idh/MocA family oxidoreductase [Amycolatopsis rubida]|uniref:Gfo/Idh/MocA family oxidoreductase n=1 Tax=Amycolatopsis rubida TaxID=112413 RepID=A0ABX0C7K3_9PSEU|nr:MULTISPECIES: Gfo/Idh/MocA family oxidoreductase [Amycolatopsis]MYW96410.1 Gfo/Idh/MocA family oxidoreductase [Amycolatopsis rubida]NEC61397.1 Gfo/Idh/MocA family oxidoreductase [Amycolatopsis rubida]OAP28132.1 Inositol 2-dehydrogenase [Amycolatopsis sp. M39]
MAEQDPQGKPRRGVAVLGAGMIAAVHRRAALLAGAEVTGVLASTPARSREVASRWQVRAGYRDLAEVLDDDRVDVVHVCTPNATHAEYAEAVLRAGKHVICEKPLGVSAGQAQRMAGLAERSGLVATVPFVYRYHPIVRELRARVRAGELGDRLLLVHGSYLQDWMLSPDASGWRVFADSGGPSRAFADIGSHWCDLVEWITGDPFAELTAATSVAVPDRPGAGGASFTGSGSGARVPVRTEDSATLLLRTESGVLASTTISQVAAGRKNRLWLELDGSLGSAVFDQETPESIWLGGADESRIVVRDNGTGSAEQRRLSQLPAGHAQGYAQCFEAFVADTYAAIDGDAPEGLPGFADGLRSARLVDAVLRSAREGSWTKVER